MALEQAPERTANNGFIFNNQNLRHGAADHPVGKAVATGLWPYREMFRAVAMPPLFCRDAH
eukprot:12809-Eustigmatos_ZCMA.PRE.1